jgi:drug/metabolite transporter (DMT)-like permease
MKRLCEEGEGMNGLVRQLPEDQVARMHADTPKPTAMVFWILWFALLNGFLIMAFVVGGGLPEGENEGKPPALIIAMAALLAVICLAIRFLAIPKTKEPDKLLPLMLVGMAFAEGIGIIGIFVVSKELPETRLALFVTSVSAIATYAPFYVHAALDRNRMR